MKMLCLLAAVFFAGATRAVAPAGGTGVAGGVISGDYVEARTASVFAGACHYNGELTTCGRSAIMAWDITSGAWNGTDLAGVRAAAAMRCDENLRDQTAARRSELVIDSSASEAQAKALTEAIESREGKVLGQVVAVRRGKVTFVHDASGYQVDAAGLISCAVQPMPDDACCTQPNLVWYTPLTPLAKRKVGFTGEAAYRGGAVGDAWERSGENSAFYGRFEF